MRIKNKKNRFNYVNYKVGGTSKKALIPSGKTIDLPLLTTISQILNIKDFNLGFLEVVEEEVKKVVEEKKLPTSKETKKTKKKKKSLFKKNKKEDSLEKIKKEVKDYTDNKDNK